MHYVHRELFENNLLGDADALMRELNRAERAARTYDQNNLMASTGTAPLDSTHAINPATSPRSTIYTNDEGGTLLQIGAGAATTVPTDARSWTDIGTSGGADLELSFTTFTATWFWIYGDGNFQGPAASTAEVAVALRLLIDGTPYGLVYEFGSHSTQTNLSLSTAHHLLLPPGSHSIKAQIREENSLGGSVVVLADRAFRLLAFGMAR